MKKLNQNFRPCALALMLCVSSLVAAQQSPPQLPSNYPNKPIRVLLGSAAGGGGDTISRAFTPKLSERLGTPLIIDNRTGASGVIALELLANAAPDGYTLYVGGTQVITATVLKKVAFDVRKVYQPIAQLTSQPHVLLVNPALPVNSVKELIALAKTKPGVLNYGSTGAGASSHLAAEVFNHMTGVKMVHVPYKGTSQIMIDLLSGELQVLFISTISGMPHVKSGKLRALAVTSQNRISKYPEIPTVIESGVIGYEKDDGYGLYAPAGLPLSILRGLSRQTIEIINSPDFVSRLAALGAEPAPASSPAEYQKKIAGQIDKLEKFFKASGVDPESWR